MTTITQLNGFAQTALAAYAHDLAVGNESNALNYKADGVGMADAQARAFDSEWAVLQQSPSNPITGFSAVLLQSRTTGEKVLAIAGTDPASPADIITDLVNVAYYGTVLGMPQYGSLESFYSQLVSAGLLGATEQITVTGHSLGGFLAQAFTARHTGVVAAAYTYNAPGFGTFELLLGFLGVTDTTGAASKITNVYATDGLSMTAGLGFMLGSTQPEGNLGQSPIFHSTRGNWGQTPISHRRRRPPTCALAPAGPAWALGQPTRRAARAPGWRAQCLPALARSSGHSSLA